MRNQSRGVTLIELVVVVAIVGILAAVAWPAYQRYERKVTRADAIRGLHIAANDLEKCAAAQGGSYIGCTFTSRDIPGNQTPNGKYALAATISVDGSAFLISATRNSGTDTECPGFQLVINSLGQQGIRKGAADPVFGTQQVRTCWNI